MLYYYSSSILAVGYEAREFGISRMIRRDEAKGKYPDLILFHVPENRGEADLTKYRLGWVALCMGYVRTHTSRTQTHTHAHT